MKTLKNETPIKWERDGEKFYGYIQSNWNSRPHEKLGLKNYIVKVVMVTKYGKVIWSLKKVSDYKVQLRDDEFTKMKYNDNLTISRRYKKILEENGLIIRW